MRGSAGMRSVEATGPRRGGDTGRLAALAVVAIGAGLAADAGVVAADESLKPFTVSYDVAYRGLDAGSAQLKLTREEAGRYTYTSLSRARGLFRLFVSNEIVQTSTLVLTEQGMRPLRYRGDDGSRGTERDVSYDFDWQARRVSGIEEDAPVDVALVDGVQDPMSVQIALIYDLLRGQFPTRYSLVDKGALKTYAYTSEGRALLRTALGELETVVYVSHRQGARRRTRLWCAPSLGFIPVQAEQTRDGKREWLMRVISLEH